MNTWALIQKRLINGVVYALGVKEVKNMKDLTEEARKKVLERIIKEVAGDILDFNKLTVLSRLLDSLASAPTCYDK